MTGYSSTPLLQKLGVRSGQVARLEHAPDGFAHRIGLDAAVLHKNETGPFDWVQAFYTNHTSFASEFDTLARSLVSNGQLWISWPKRSSGVKTDLSEHIIREFGLDHGMVDVKVAAIDEVWSGLKFVFRLHDRQ